MANRKNPKRENVRVDPEETTLDPSSNLLKLMRPDGTPLAGNGNLTEDFQYCWVQKSNENQYARYQGLGYRLCRYADNEVRPEFAMFTEHEETDEALSGVIERAGVALMRRPIRYRHQEEARTRAKSRERAIAMGKISPADQRMARSGGSYIESGETRPDHTFGL